jgi:acyl-CoA thioesterase-1
VRSPSAGSSRSSHSSAPPLVNPAGRAVRTLKNTASGWSRPETASLGGTLGADWVEALRRRHPEVEVVNAGVNGDTSRELLNRVDSDVVNCAPKATVILIGTNDVRSGVPTDVYRANLETIVVRVKTGTAARIALMSLPPMGEDLATSINQTVAEYNTAIRETAAQTGTDYLPLHEMIAADLQASASKRMGYDFGFLRSFGAAAQFHLLGKTWDEVAQSAGMEFLIDHIHLSDTAGEIVTELTSGWLADQPLP